MKRRLSGIFIGKGNFSNGLIAMIVLGLIVLGCTCNNGKFDFGKKKNTNSSQPVEDDSPKKDGEYEKVDASKGEIPSDAELQDMVRADMLAFDKALKEKSFSDFYKRISKFWQSQTTPGKLKRGFKGLIDGKADLSGVENLDADFSPTPSIDNTKNVKVLEVEGSYPTKKRDSTFELKYIPEGDEWKLIGFFVKTTIYKKR